MEADLLKEKQRLVEKLGVLIENNDKLAPVAARIVSYAILTGKSGLTFDDLVTDLCASKSTISTHLNHLLDLKKLTYFTKVGDRKKYYIVSSDSIFQHINGLIDMWSSIRDLHLEIKTYKENVNAVSEEEQKKFDLEFHNNYIMFLDEIIGAVTGLKNKIIDKQSEE
ncbi:MULTISPECIES: GbsR/MarR family transcriptional regulator [Mangrovimonas]|uniref:GbsR/MarR family transcriptional regulator n=1 Tax=Mangrovimonas TaxID=1211036 RepID=UPI0006B62196|nr:MULTISPECIES: transcriptional regulator [Mangrovimonas]OMP32049.1 transcriptional regulator [Mangrovimonas sp. DI 80]